MKYIKLFIFTFFAISLFNINCSASTKLYTRTSDNLRVPKEVVVTNENLQDILNTPSVDASEKIYDYAELLNDSEEEKAIKLIKDYVSSSSIDAVIVTTKNLNGYSISDYAYNFYDYNHFNESGIIFVIYINDVEPEIYMGNSGPNDGEVFSIYTDNRINQTLAYVYKDIKAGNCYSAVEKYMGVLQGFYDLEKQSGGDDTSSYEVGEDGRIVKKIPWVEIVILSVALSFVIIVVLLYRLKGKNKVVIKDNLDENLNNSTLIVKCDSDELVDTSLSRNK